MLTAPCRIVALLVGLTLVLEVHSYDLNSQLKTEPYIYENNAIIKPSLFEEELTHRIQSMMDAYSRETPGGGHQFMEKNPAVDSKYRIWKRNVDLINALLGLPKGMHEAGR